MRIDFDSEFLHKKSGFSLAANTSFDATLRIPNLERRFRLFVTNNSIQEDPVLDPAQQPNPVRAGLRFTPASHVDLEFGAHARIRPSAFGALNWGRTWGAGSLRFYPFAKVYAETGSGLGVAAGLGVDRWSGRWVVRSASYAGPMVRWNRDFDWHPDAGVQIGFDALFWGLATPRAELADYC